MTVKNLNRKLLLVVVLLLALVVPAYSADRTMQERGKEAVKEFAASRAITPAATAVLVTDLSDGSTIASLNATTPLVPASIMKAVTIASLLRQTGPKWKYRTQVMHDGKIKKGVLDGNLIIEGACDPSVSSSCEPAGPDFVAEIVSTLKEAGITRITGRIIIDESRFPGPACPPTWASADLQHSYGTGIHGFNYRNNASGKKSVGDPGAWFRHDLERALAEEYIALEGRSKPEKERSLLMVHESAPVEEIMRSCMMRSDNMFAESMLRTLGSIMGRNGSTSEGTSVERELWTKYDAPMEGVTLIDGSGLSRSNRVTARFMEHVLRHEKDNVDYASFMPLAGQEGTLKKFLAETPLDSYMAMKTGSMNGIQCYAGYKLDEDFAPTHAVVVMLNALPAGRPAARDAVERLLLDIFVDSDAETDNP